MAKKKGKRDDTFTFPEFDGEEYRNREIRDSKVALFAVAYAIVMALICYYIVKLTELRDSTMILGFISPFGLILILPYVTDTSEFERKNWFGPMFMSFLAWLGLFILLSNPPFNDISKPNIQQMEVYVESDGEWNLTSEIKRDTPFLLVITVKDNWEVDEVQFSGSKSGSGFLTYQSMSKLEEGNQFGITGNNLYSYYFADGLAVDSYKFTFKASDGERNTDTKSRSLTVT
tara:strand:- start:384 stop:1076 length:693 start_codon:yes stop_codon:yes gene_type:complete